MRRHLTVALALALLIIGIANTASAHEIKLAYIDPLSGGGASVGEIGLKTFQFLADEINAKGGLMGQKLVVIPFDNKTNPQESLVQAQKATTPESASSRRATVRQSAARCWNSSASSIPAIRARKSSTSTTPPSTHR